MEHAKEIEAARTDQVPRIRRFNFVTEDLHFLYQGPYKKLSGDSWIEGIYRQNLIPTKALRVCF